MIPRIIFLAIGIALMSTFSCLLEFCLPSLNYIATFLLTVVIFLPLAPFLGKRESF